MREMCKGIYTAEVSHSESINFQLPRKCIILRFIAIIFLGSIDRV